MTLSFLHHKISIFTVLTFFITSILHGMEAKEPPYIMFKMEGLPGYSELLIETDTASSLFPLIKDVLAFSFEDDNSTHCDVEHCGTSKDGKDIFAIPFEIKKEMQDNFNLKPHHIRQLCSLAVNNFRAYTKIHSALKS